MLKFIPHVIALTFFVMPTTSIAETAAKSDNPVLEAVFDAVEKELIGDYYKNKHEEDDKDKKEKSKSKSMPHGLAKKETLPPGLAKRIEVKGELPPGIQKRDLPEDLSKRLPPVKEGTKRVVTDKDIVLIEEATGVVLDVIRDVIKE